MRTLASVLCATGLVLVLAACAGAGGSTGTGGVLGAATTKSSATVTRTTTTKTAPSVCRGGTKVKMRVFKGPDSATLALVPVTIGGRGPYVFALDTGAAKSAVDTKLAKRLGLHRIGSSHRVEGISGATTAQIVSVKSWQLGSIHLRSDQISSLNLFGGAHGPVGLLGSDVLSRFSSVCLDYQAGVLRLGTRSGS